MYVLDVLQPTRANRMSLLKAESEKNFREREMSSVLQDLGVREKIGELFNKVKGATGESCWRVQVVSRSNFASLLQLEAGIIFYII